MSGKSERIPGWTDRIVFKNKPDSDLVLVNYDCGVDVFGSDHRPVFAQFLCDFPKQSQ